MIYTIDDFQASPQEENSTSFEPAPDFSQRPSVRGKFIFVGNRKYWIKGVTYGTFRPDDKGEQFPDRSTVSRDFASMAAHGINTVRTYTPAPRWLLDEAQRHGLRVMVGLSWEQHITFLDDEKLCVSIVERVRDGVKRCAKHPALLCFSIGNEIPASVVRWHGHKAIEAFLRRLYKLVKQLDRHALVTYVNYPTTEYLQLGFLDLQCYNVYLEEPAKLEAYLARLQNIAGDKPLLMAEMGLDSRRHGEQCQAEALQWQIHSAFTSGCCGMFVYAWTDEWYRGGYDIEDWDFGLTTRDRRPKQALKAVTDAFRESPFPSDIIWPRISVVCCTYNGSRTIRDTLEGVKRLLYPDFEVIVINDGSTDCTAEIVQEYDVRLISIDNGGLSHARNIGWQEATGEIVAYIDDDAYPDPHWLHYLAWTFLHKDFVGVGGPNIAPPGDGRIADCVANAPGGPVHVLVSDIEAEHIPGCNMAFRREALAAVDGFDARYRTAGDDVDLCWRLQHNGGRLGFHAGAMNWHHRRNDLKTYWKQQIGYGHAEALLEEKWPLKYNAAGHFSWSGRLYGRGLTHALPLRSCRIYGGSCGSALFQSIYEPSAGFFSSLFLMPEWYLITGIIAVLTLLGFAWHRLFWLWPLLVLCIAAPIAQAILSAFRAEFPTPRPSLKGRLALRGLTGLMHLMQPLARLIGRLQHGLTPWRRRIGIKPKLKWLYRDKLWSEEWHSPETWIRSIIDNLIQKQIPATQGGDFDPWDIEVRGGLLGLARMQVAIEEHGGGKQMLCYHIRPRFKPCALLILILLSLMALEAYVESAYTTSFVLCAGVSILLLQALRECFLATSALSFALCHAWQATRNDQPVHDMKRDHSTSETKPFPKQGIHQTAAIGFDRAVTSNPEKNAPLAKEKVSR